MICNIVVVNQGIAALIEYLPGERTSVLHPSVKETQQTYIEIIVLNNFITNSSSIDL